MVVNQIQIVQKGEKMIQFEYKDGQWYEVAGDTQKLVDIDAVIVTLLIVKQFKEISGWEFITPTYMTSLSLSN